MAQPPEGRLLLALAGWSPPDAIHVAWCSQRCAACHRAAGTAARAASAGPPSSCAMAAQDRRAQIQTLSQASRRSARVPSCPSAPASICKIISTRSIQKRKSRQRPAKIMSKQRRHVPHPTSRCPSLPTHTQPHLAHKSHPLSRARAAGRSPRHETTQSQKCGEHEAEPRRAPRQPCAPLPLLSCTAIVPGTSLPGGDGSRIRPSRAACPMRSPLTPRPGPHTLGLVI